MFGLIVGIIAASRARVRQVARDALVDARPEVQVAAERIHVVHADHRVGRQLVRPAGVALHLVRRLQPRVDPLPEQRELHQERPSNTTLVKEPHNLRIAWPPSYM